MPRRLLQRATAVAAIAVGVLGLAAPLLLGGLARAQAGQELLDGARPFASPDGSARLRDDTELTIRGFDELLNGELPALGQALGLSANQFDAVLESNFPSIAAGRNEAPDAVVSLDRIVANLETQSADFDQADRLPIDGISLPVATALMIAVSATLVVLGLYAWRVDRRWVRLALVALPLASVVWTIGTQSPQKAAAAERVIASLNLTDSTTDDIERQLAAADAFATEYQGALLPAVATELGVTLDELNTGLAARYPASALLRSEEGTESIANIASAVTFRRRNIDNFQLVRGEPLAAYVWGAIAAFAAVAVLAACSVQRRTIADTQLGVDTPDA